MGQLLTALWNDPPGSARQNLRLNIARLRGQLDHLALRDRLVTLRGGGGGYRLLVEADEVDVLRFKGLAARGFAELRAGRPDAAEAGLVEALKLWEGPIGQDCTVSDHLRARFFAYEELHLTVRERLVEARLRLGRTNDLIPEIEDVLAVAPFRESVWAHLMRAHYLGGDVAGALGAWDRAVATLGGALGLDPSGDLRALHVAVLRRDDGAVRGATLPGRAPGREPGRDVGRDIGRDIGGGIGGGIGGERPLPGRSGGVTRLIVFRRDRARFASGTRPVPNRPSVAAAGGRE